MNDNELRRFLFKKQFDSTISLFKTLSYVCIGVAIIYFALNYHINNKFKPNQIWVYQFKSTNPFNTFESWDTVYILDVKKDFVLYKQDNIIQSDQCRWVYSKLNNYYRIQ